MPGILLGRGSNDSRWKINLLVMAFTATSVERARGRYIGQQGRALGPLADQISVARHLFF